MTNASLLYPVFFQVLLVFAVTFWMGRERTKAVRHGKVKASAFILRNADLPDRAAKVSNNYLNQFEMPVLFYALVPLIIITGKVDIYFVVMAWIYVALRYLHAITHIMVRSLSRRFLIFMASCLVLFAMWVLFALRIISGGMQG